MGRAARGRFRQPDRQAAGKSCDCPPPWPDFLDLSPISHPCGFRAGGGWRRGSEAVEVCSVPSLLVMTGEWHAWVTQSVVNVTRLVFLSLWASASPNPTPTPNPHTARSLLFSCHTKGRRRRGDRVARGHGGGCARPTAWAPVARRETETRAFSVLFLFRVDFLFLRFPVTRISDEKGVDTLNVAATTSSS